MKQSVTDYLVETNQPDLGTKDGDRCGRNGCRGVVCYSDPTHLACSICQWAQADTEELA
jgi:hypothetical protein